MNVKSTSLAEDGLLSKQQVGELLPCALYIFSHEPHMFMNFFYLVEMDYCVVLAFAHGKRRMPPALVSKTPD